VALLTDASKFVAAFEYPISESAPHIYVSALPFTPLESKILQHIQDDYVNLLEVKNGRSKQWSAVTQVIHGHSGSVVSVAFSPDGKHIVSGSSDNTVRVWDAESGQAIGEPLQGHSGSVYSVAFSPDGKHIVSGSDDMTTQFTAVWDAESGQAIGEPLQGHSGGVWSVAFSPDGKHIVSGSS
jgi:WD40 repeat protein